MDQVFELATPLPGTSAELYDWHTRPGAFLRLAPPWQRIELVGDHPVIEDGSRVELRLKKGPFWVRWTAEHQGVRPGRSFQDRQVRGPFAHWLHTHDFEPTAPAGVTLRDRIEYRLPGGAVGALVGGRSIAGDLARTFRYRHATTRADLALHRQFADRPRLTVAVTGASGLIGRCLVALLASGGHRVLALGRDGTAETPTWSPSEGLEHPERLPAIDAVVHLAGENIAGGRWSRARRRRIRDSRVEGTIALVESFRRLASTPKTLVSASAVGIYGDRGDEVLDESRPPGSGFLARVGIEWESAAAAAEDLGMRVVCLRFGVVLTPAGGFLGRLLPLFRLGLGGPVGSGEQFVSWISIDDAVGVILQALMDETMVGAVNAVAPKPVPQRELARSLGRALRRPTPVPLPAFAARGAFGELADELLLASVAARPRRLLASAYRFRHPQLDLALAHLLGTARLA